MSVSTYSRQVNSLTSDLADLRSKLAAEKKKLADATDKAVRATDALGRAKSSSQLTARGRDLARAQKAIADQERKAAELEKRIATKQKALSSAQASLGRAERNEQQKADREAEKRRRADLDHIKAMERGRRSQAVLPAAAHARPPSIALPPAGSRHAVRKFTDTYDVCLSFAGEQRDYVERIAADLKQAGLTVFYDQDRDVSTKLWGEDLGEYLDYIYRRASRFCVMFISSDYAEKVWTTHERRSALARAIEDGGGYVLPARFDDTDLDGLQPTIGYLDLRQVAPATLVEFIVEKLRSSEPDPGPSRGH